MPTTAERLRESAKYTADLAKHKTALAETLTECGVEASTDETYSTLVPKNNEKMRQLSTFYDEVTNGGTDFSYLFSGDTNRTELPPLDTSKGIRFSGIVSGCRNLSGVSLDTRQGEDFQGAFSSAKIATAPQVDLSNALTLRGCFQGATISEAVHYDTSKCTDFYQAFHVAQIPEVHIDTSNGGNLFQLFNGCTIPHIGVIDMRNVGKTWSGGNSNFIFNSPRIVTIDKIIVGEESSFFASGNPLPTYNGGLVNVTIEGTLKGDINLSANPLSLESAKSIITALVDFAGTDYAFDYTIKFSSTTLGYLEAEGATAPNGKTWVEYCEDKGWNC